MTEEKNIRTQLAKFQAECPQIPLNSEVAVKTSNGTYKFKYASLGSIKETIQPILSKHGLSYLQHIGENGTVLRTVMYYGCESVSSDVPFSIFNTVLNKDTGAYEKTELSDQELGSRLTYRKRYGLALALGLVAEEDDDANIAEGNTYKKKDWFESKDGNICYKGVWFNNFEADMLRQAKESGQDLDQKAREIKTKTTKNE